MRMYTLARLFQLSPSSSSIDTHRTNAFLAPSQSSSLRHAHPSTNHVFACSGLIAAARLKQSIASP